jgi:hypothetical protein
MPKNELGFRPKQASFCILFISILKCERIERALIFILFKQKKKGSARKLVFASNELNGFVGQRAEHVLKAVHI